MVRVYCTSYFLCPVPSKYELRFEGKGCFCLVVKMFSGSLSEKGSVGCHWSSVFEGRMSGEARLSDVVRDLMTASERDNVFDNKTRNVRY
jgi:hypothetical protein